MNKHASIFVAGHHGLVGSAICRALEHAGFTQINTVDRAQLDLTDTAAVLHYFKQIQPEYVFLAAAKVGGIMANKTYPVDFLMENLKIAESVVDSAYKCDVKKLLFLGSSCIYPKMAQQPIKEEYLLTGALEPTNDAYAIAKIAGIKMCEAYRDQYGCNFISAMPTNLYGPGDNFHPENSHVLPALLRRFHEAERAGRREVLAWGSGSPLREFLYVDDLADACVHLMHMYDERETVNVGTGEDVSIKELTELVAKTVAYTGKIAWDTSKPDGTPRKLLDVSRIHATGWHHTTSLEEGLKKMYDWYLNTPDRRM